MAASKSQITPSHVLADPSAQDLARVYAKAYLDGAAGANVTNPLEELTSFNDDVLEPNPEFAQLLTSEMTGRAEKLGIIDRVVAPQASEFFTGFLKVLASRDRLVLLPMILSEAWLESETRDNKIRVLVKSSSELSESQLGRIKERLQTALGKEPILLPSVDPDMLGGLLLQVKDTIYDGSLRTRLKNMQTKLRERYLNEIQSGRNRFSNHG